MKRILKTMWIYLVILIGIVTLPQKVKADTTSNDWNWPTYIHTLKNDWPNYATSGKYHG